MIGPNPPPFRSSPVSQPTPIISPTINHARKYMDLPLSVSRAGLDCIELRRDPRSAVCKSCGTGTVAHGGHGGSCVTRRLKHTPVCHLTYDLRWLIGKSVCFNRAAAVRATHTEIPWADAKTFH